MAAEHHKPFILFRPNFILLCLYVGAYAWLRSADQIVERGAGPLWGIAAAPDLPHWRRQAWRALFSLPMVLEEEARRHEDVARDFYEEAVAAIRPARRVAAPAPDFSPAPQYQEPQFRLQPAARPVQQRQVQQAPQPQQMQSFPPLNEGERVIYMPTPEEQRRQQSLYREEQY